MPAFSFVALRRWPDVEAENLFAVDATDRLIIDEAAAAVRAHPDAVAVIGDHYGALTLGAIATLGAQGVRVHQDPLSGELALANNADAVGLVDDFTSRALDADLLTGARVVLLQLPKSLAALREIAEMINVHADPEVIILAGGRLKHMTRSMNDVLGECFFDVRATLARQKSRALIATGPRPEIVPTFPVREWDDDLRLWVCAHGGVFGGAKIDVGTRLLLACLDKVKPDARDAVDLGCGTGVLAAALARTRSDLAVIATDESSTAVSSAAETARANDLTERITILRDDAMSTVDDHSVDLIVCNPPFHIGATVHAGASLKLFEAARRVLRPGGELWTVFNTHLGHQGNLERLVGRTEVAARDARFTVTVSRVRGEDRQSVR